ncbi:hypothetical protein [Streptomyces sp. NBC_01530]|uniref:hypothetical protein n=1 Tax=Streptomyces sp. NBC_01530 TaxID=2903895 RepID=UPI00386E7987
MTGLRPDFVENASTPAIRAQYERAQARADMGADQARDLFLLLCQREDLADRPTSTGDTTDKEAA